VPATSAGLPRKAFYAAINSTKETNKDSGTHHLSVYITLMSMEGTGLVSFYSLSVIVTIRKEFEFNTEDHFVKHLNIKTIDNEYTQI
jgi:hypothetical protein